MTWNFNIDEAPKGYYKTTRKKFGKVEKEVREHVPVKIIAAGNDGVVTISRWLPDEGRWNMFSKDVPPLAWQHWPEHPNSRATGEKEARDG